MSLNLHLRPGQVVICDFDTGFEPPEMVKRRPVVVISPRTRRQSPLCVVVPLSTAVPNPVEPFHHRMDPRSLAGNLSRRESWAKCDMPYTVSTRRLGRIMVGMQPDGKPIYGVGTVTSADLAAIRRCVSVALGLVDVA